LGRHSLHGDGENPLGLAFQAGMMQGQVLEGKLHEQFFGEGLEMSRKGSAPAPHPAALLQVDQAAPSDQDVPGTSKNAVLTQVWAAMTYFLLLAYIKFQCRFQRSLFLLHRLVQNTLLDRLSLIDLLRLPEKKLPMLRNTEPQLCLAL